MNSTSQQKAMSCFFMFDVISQQQVEVSISVNREAVVRVYRGKIDKQMLEKCGLSDFRELEQYLRQSTVNWDINEQDLKFSIVAETSMRGKKSRVDLLTIPLELTEKRETKLEKLSNVIERCSVQQQLNSDDIKAMFLQVVSHIRSLEQGGSSNEVIDSVISKITIAGNQVEYLKSHVISIEQQIERQLKQDELKFAQVAKQILLIAEEQKMQAEQLKQAKQLFKENRQELTKTEAALGNQWRKQLDRAINEQTQSTAAKLAELAEQYRVVCQIVSAQCSKKQDIMKPIGRGSLKKQKPSASFDELFTVVNQEIDNYIIDRLKATKVASKSGNSGINGKIPIAEKSTFAMRVEHTRAWGISIGIKDLTSMQIIKYGGNGWISNCANTIYSQGKGLNSGDTVIITVDVAKGVIKWKVENKKSSYNYETKCQNVKITHPERFWVPFVQMSSEDDSVEIV